MKSPLHVIYACLTLLPKSLPDFSIRQKKHAMRLWKRLKKESLEVRDQECHNRKDKKLSVLEAKVIELIGVDLSLCCRIVEEITIVVRRKPKMHTRLISL